MRLKILCSGIWTVIAPLDAAGECPVEAELATFMDDPRLRASVVGFGAAWRRIPALGPHALGTALYHCVDENHGIYEFIKGPLRLLCFEASGRLVVCSHTLRKKTQKTPSQDKARARKLKEDYLAASAAGQVIVVDDDQE